MNTHNFIDRDGSTPLDHEQIVGIRFSHLTTMGELDELEDENIQKGLEWINHQRSEHFLYSKFLCKLHDENGRSINIKLNFLPAGWYKVNVYKDAPNASWSINPYAMDIHTIRVHSNQSYNLHLAPGGGLALEFIKE